MCHPGDSLMTDKGFNVQDIFEKYDAKRSIYHICIHKKQISNQAIMTDRRVASKRFTPFTNGSRVFIMLQRQNKLPLNITMDTAISRSILARVYTDSIHSYRHVFTCPFWLLGSVGFWRLQQRSEATYFKYIFGLDIWFGGFYNAKLSRIAVNFV